MGWDIVYGEVINIEGFPAPVWSGAPTYTVTEGQVVAYSLPVSVSNGSSISVAWVAPGLKPSWILFANGTSPSITFQGDQVNADDRSGVVISATANGQTVNSPSGTFTIDPAAVVGNTITTFTLSATSATTAAPFTFALAFKQGDVPAGYVTLATEATDFQCRVLTAWSDGSAKHAIIAGRANTINGNTVLTLTSGNDPGGAALTETDLSTALPTTTIAAGAFTWTLNSSVGTADLHRTVCTGPVMSNFIYRKAVSGSNHLVLWADVRVYKGGNVEIFPWVENAYLTVAGPTNDIRTYNVTIGGVSRFNQSIDVKHHTRIPLLTGSTFSYWTGADPGITPKHDRTYLMSTKLVPNYGYTSPSETVLKELPQTYTPNTLAGMSTGMGAGGTSAALIGHSSNNSHALYVTSNADVRAYKAAVVFGLSGGSWSTHYRDESTNNPLKFTSYPSASTEWGGTPSIPAGTGGENGTAVISHQPSFGYVPFLLTGRWWFWEESAFWATWNYLYARPDTRRGETNIGSGVYRNANGSAGIIDSRGGGGTARAAPWAHRTLAQTLALCPSSHPIYTDLKASWEAHTDFYSALYVNGTFGSGWVCPQGDLGQYASTPDFSWNGDTTSWWGAAWESAFAVQMWGYSSELGLPQTAQSEANHLAVRNHAYKIVTSRLGDNTTFNWRRFGVYYYPFGADSAGAPPEIWYTPAQSHAKYLSVFGLASIQDTAGLSLKQHSSDTDMTGGAFDSTASDYFKFSFAGLAYAVDHGATGAAAGYNKIIGASNFNAIVSLWNDNPSHAIAPRVSTVAPAWLSGVPINGWTEIAGTKLSDQPTIAGSNVGTPYGKQDSWCGWHIDTRNSTVYSVGQGGHADYVGNEVNAIDLSVASPAWTEVLAPTPFAQVTSQSTDDYYADGRPTSVHGYHTSVFIESLNRAMRFQGGSRSTQGAPLQILTAFNTQSGTYDVAGTFTDYNAGIGAGDGAYAKHPTTENVYCWFYNGSIRRWNVGIPGSWTTLITNPPNPAVHYTAAAVDPSRGTAGEVFFLGGGSSPVCRVYDIGSNTLRTITLSGTDISSQASLALVYVSSIDKYVACIQYGTGGGGSCIYTITPNSGSTWACSVLATTGGTGLAATTGNTAWAPYTKFLYAPNLGGCVYSPRWGSNVWFLRLHAV